MIVAIKQKAIPPRSLLFTSSIKALNHAKTFLFEKIIFMSNDSINNSDLKFAVKNISYVIIKSDVLQEAQHCSSSLNKERKKF